VELSSSSYAVISLTTDRRRGTVVPVGVALWSPSGGVRVRLLRPEESLPSISSTDRPFIHLLEAQLSKWIREPAGLPWFKEPIAASTDAWWRGVRNALVHKVSVTEPRPIACNVSEASAERLFSEIVGVSPVVRSLAPLHWQPAFAPLAPFQNAMPSVVSDTRPKDYPVLAWSSTDGALGPLPCALNAAEAPTPGRVPALVGAVQGILRPPTAPNPIPSVAAGEVRPLVHDE
jgi:hypothetical protein